MNLKLMEDKGRLVAAVTGEIDHHNALLLREKVDRQIAAMRPAELCIDLSGVEFMDSSGLGGKVSVKGAKGRVEAVLQMAGAYRYVEKIEGGNPV